MKDKYYVTVWWADAPPPLKMHTMVGHYNTQRDAQSKCLFRYAKKIYEGGFKDLSFKLLLSRIKQECKIEARIGY